jgi:hypothetical protein
MKPSDSLRVVGFFLVMGLAAGCGGGGGGGSATVDPKAPVIANLRVALRKRCTLESGRAGTIEVLTFDYADADGNLVGGIVENTAAAVAGGPFVFNLPIPSPGVTITGTTAGTITLGGCLHFGGNASATEQVRVFDASGKVSNTLTVEVAKPDGAPLLPRDADPALRKSF